MSKVRIPDFSECFHLVEDSHCFDWEEAAVIIEREGKPDRLGQLWTGAAGYWISKLASEQEEAATVFETANLLVMSSSPAESQRSLGLKLENALQSLLSYLGSASDFERFGKMGVLVFADSLSYSNYIARFYPEGSVAPMSGGLCITEGYVHVALFEDEWGDLISAFVHEATHAYVSHLSLPIWMEEAIAMRMENLIAGRPEYQLDQELYQRHQAYWNLDTLRQFKSGESWTIVGESFDLSYQLAEILWKKIESNLEAQPTELQKLIAEASWQDGGEQALLEIFEVRIDDLIRSFLGDF